MHEHETLRLLERLMSTLQDQITAQTAVLNQILQAIQAQAPAKVDDLTPVTTAQATAQSSLTAIQSDLVTLQTTTNAIAAKLPVDGVGGTAGT